jgi:hypothetical protein
MMKLLLAGSALAALAAHAPAHAQNTSCGWDNSTLSYRGTDAEQTICLLRKVEIGGRLRNQSIPAGLLSRVGRAYAPAEGEIERAIDLLPPAQRSHFREGRARPVSATSAGHPARYFVIHDTSTPYLRDLPFPADLDGDARINRLTGYLGPNAKAHYFVNRRGEIGVGHDFAVPWRATKVELRVAGAPSRGRFLHIELVQPRRRDPAAGGPDNDRLAPQPGFSDRQYRVLAALYVLASARARRWLIPGFHAAIDAGIPGAHDDPQNFDIARFAAEVDSVLAGPASPRGG